MTKKELMIQQLETFEYDFEELLFRLVYGDKSDPETRLLDIYHQLCMYMELRKLPGACSMQLQLDKDAVLAMNDDVMQIGAMLCSMLEVTSSRNADKMCKIMMKFIDIRFQMSKAPETGEQEVNSDDGESDTADE